MTKCNLCESEDVIKFGFNYFENHKTQKYKCRDCNKIFCYQDKLPRNHVSSEIVSLCFDLYFKGLSYRVIRQHILEQFNLRVNHVTIYNWIQSYSEKIKNYVDGLNPNLSPVWQIDETFIAFKGSYGDKIKRTKGNWCWVGIDTSTRYIVDMFLTSDRMMDTSENFFKRIKTVETNPEVIATDSLPAYGYCIKKYYPKATHVRLKHISIKPNTSFIERYNSTIKNRTKTMRCFESFCSCQNTLTAFQIYYNFLRPHMALDGKTPAQAAGINLNLPERWLSLIRYALSC